MLNENKETELRKIEVSEDDYMRGLELYSYEPDFSYKLFKLDTLYQFKSQKFLLSAL